MDERKQLGFRDYWSGLSAAEKQALAEACITTVNYLTQVACGHRQASPALSLALHEQTGRVVRLSSLRADIWPAETAPVKKPSPRKKNHAEAIHGD